MYSLIDVLRWRNSTVNGNTENVDIAISQLESTVTKTSINLTVILILVDMTVGTEGFLSVGDTSINSRKSLTVSVLTRVGNIAVQAIKILWYN